MNLTEKQELTITRTFKHAVVKTVNGNPEVAIVEAAASYIPIEQFKEIFAAIGDLVKEKKITKLIFDKRKLTVFHQPSMEWYFVEWKEQMFELGLKTHRKILPQDEVFKQSVKIGREKIKANHPLGKYLQMDIRYADTLEDAILN
ncbi:MAG TPA: hypothetical protein PLV21_14500 [Cyclobacteriaceae bacterium]|nr:hypothetical protein [Cyclobacteriaceae bacterium]HRJ83098.1 hypothetical protein [Cyclobacteriaceae bacterium]